MSLENLINEDLKQAMLTKDSRKLEALRAIKASLLLIKTGKDVRGGEIPQTIEISLLQRLVKQRKEAAEIYLEKNRPALAEVELYQVLIIEKYLPDQISEKELNLIIKDIIEKSGATSIKDMGKVMGLASKELTGRAENKIIAQLVKKLLGIG
ncbi:MAG: GatB/YqeY domain-containing protein [Bacteroidetes bacterium]|nr:GatB/YqeY domain-containing protein [Bacteroidota bacterium]